MINFVTKLRPLQTSVSIQIKRTINMCCCKKDFEFDIEWLFFASCHKKMPVTEFVIPQSEP